MRCKYCNTSPIYRCVLQSNYAMLTSEHTDVGLALLYYSCSTFKTADEIVPLPPLYFVLFLVDWICQCSLQVRYCDVTWWTVYVCCYREQHNLPFCFLADSAMPQNSCLSWTSICWHYLIFPSINFRRRKYWKHITQRTDKFMIPVDTPKSVSSCFHAHKWQV